MIHRKCCQHQWQRNLSMLGYRKAHTQMVCSGMELTTCLYQRSSFAWLLQKLLDEFFWYLWHTTLLDIRRSASIYLILSENTILYLFFSVVTKGHNIRPIKLIVIIVIYWWERLALVIIRSDFFLIYIVIHIWSIHLCFLLSLYLCNPYSALWYTYILHSDPFEKYVRGFCN